jgi:hypothetical protein
VFHVNAVIVPTDLCGCEIESYSKRIKKIACAWKQETKESFLRLRETNCPDLLQY